jgi:hypothetical protein
MPLTLTQTEGVLPVGSESAAVSRLTEAMLKWHGLLGNKVMTPNVTATVHVLPKSATFSAGKPFAGAWVEWKVPGIAFADREIQQGFFADATDIIHELSARRQPREHIFVNVVHAVDGAWSLNGQAVTNTELGAAVAKG